MNNIESKINPSQISFVKNIRESTPQKENYYGETFCVFKSINNLLILIYEINITSLISYDLVNDKQITEIKNIHKLQITNIRHYIDTINNRNILLSISSEENNLKVWNIKNWDCIYNYINVNKNMCLYSACFLNYQNQNYIITNNNNFDTIKIYDLKGNKIKEIDDCIVQSFFIDTYLDKKYSKIYIITGNKGFVKSYDYEKNVLYNKYNSYDYKIHGSIIIYDNEDLIKLIESCVSGHIRIWNFHSGDLINDIISESGFYGICLWNNDYLFVSSTLNFKLINIKNGKIIDKEFTHKKKYYSPAQTIKKFVHPKYGECLILENSKEIDLWSIKSE